MFENDDFFTLDPVWLNGIFEHVQESLCEGSMTLERANSIGYNMPEGWQFAFEETDED